MTHPSPTPTALAAPPVTERAGFRYTVRRPLLNVERQQVVDLVNLRLKDLLKRELISPGDVPVRRAALDHVNHDLFALWDEQTPIGALLLRHRARLGLWSLHEHRQPALEVDAMYSVPGGTDRAGLLMTLWLRDQAAREGGIDVLRGHVQADGREARLVDYLVHSCGWQHVRQVETDDGRTFELLQTTPEAKPGLHALIDSPGISIHPHERAAQ